MSEERKAKLDALPWWVWLVSATPVVVAWEARFDELVAYHAEHGRVPPQLTPGLGTWVQNQRSRSESMSTERKARLEALEWWEWDARGDAWSVRFEELVAYHAEHGRLPPQSSPGGIGSWVSGQRAKRETMGPDRKARLDALGWWVWRVRGRGD